jgi:hypothetical protein
MLLKVLFLVMALAMGSPVTAVRQRTLLVDVDRYNDRNFYGKFYSEDQTIFTSLSFNVGWQAAGGVDYGYLNYVVVDSITMDSTLCDCVLTLPGTYEVFFRTAQFGNCHCSTSGNNPPPSALNGCSQLLARLTGQPNDKDRCNIKEFNSDNTNRAQETILVRYSEKSKWVPASGTVEGVDCGFTVPVSGGIGQSVSVYRIKTNKD